MNILCISHEFPPIGGGGATACKNITQKYAARGHSVTVMTAAFEDTPPFERNEGVNIIRLKCKRANKDNSSFAEMLSFLLCAFRQVPKIIKKEKFDVVHIFFGIPSGPLGWYIKKRYNIPYIVRLGGGDIPGTQKRFDKIYTLISPFLKMIWRNADHVTANSSGLLERARRYYHKANFSVIPNGINIEDYPDEKTTRSNGKLQLITTARIVERKGIQHVIDTLSALVKETDGNILYTIVGDGPYRKEIEELAVKLGVSEYIEITGILPFSDVMKKLQSADIFVLMSHWEGMPNVVLEAMASHLPIIMTNCEGSSELIEDNGFIIDLNSDISAELAKTVKVLYNSTELMKKMGHKSYERVRDNFSWERTAEEYLGLFVL